MAKKQKDTRPSQDPKPRATAAPDEGSFSEALAVGPRFVLADLDPESTPGFSGSKKDGEEALDKDSGEVGDWQERLFAEAKGGGTRSLLLVIQGMDTSGKGGIMRHVFAAVDPEGIRTTAFKAPTPAERRHGFLWRVRAALPGPGKLGVFDRSHYEDVLIVRVHDLVPQAVWSKRYAQINAFEREVVAAGTEVVKVMLHISKDEQRARLARRLRRPDKHYKYNPGDVQQLLLERLRAMDPQWPDMGLDVKAEQARLAAS